ncbi:hypothetical protein CDL12_04671 [Handroanthus impetiginosus]|uniref:CASP-like protein n=1 Tax=Handroanthus impetiginosus TaxID=429701 RepID=A0A2G9HYL5_9LAMI|nr:hypothetical protein CDL12_04671 [Handroanthus impetiginosus]
MSHLDRYDHDNGVSGYGSKFPVTRLAARVVTLASLVVSIAVLKTNDVTIAVVDMTTGVKGYAHLTYNYFHSYKYMFSVTLIGIGYTLLQIPFAIYYMRTKRHLINNLAFLKFEFYADMIMTFVLATGVGAGLGASLDLKKINYDKSESHKIHGFLTKSYVSAVFFLFGSFASGISAVLSSLAVTKNINN